MEITPAWRKAVKLQLTETLVLASQSTERKRIRNQPRCTIQNRLLERGQIDLGRPLARVAQTLGDHSQRQTLVPCDSRPRVSRRVGREAAANPQTSSNSPQAAILKPQAILILCPGATSRIGDHGKQVLRTAGTGSEPIQNPTHSRMNGKLDLLAGLTAPVTDSLTPQVTLFQMSQVDKAHPPGVVTE